MIEVLGIDPGVNPAVCYIREHGGKLEEVRFFEGDETSAKVMRGSKVRREPVPVLLRELFLSLNPRCVFLEKISPRPKEGAASAFAFARAAALIEGVAVGAGFNLHLVRPQEWRKSFRLGPGKEGNRAKAASLIGIDHAHLFSKVRDHNRADAFLIGFYGLTMINLGRMFG